MRIENKDIIPILDSLTPDGESEDHEQFMRTKAAMREALTGHIPINILVSGKTVSIERDVCEEAREIAALNSREGDPSWDDPVVIKIRRKIGARLDIAVSLVRHPDFHRFLRYLRSENGTFYFGEFFTKQYQSIYRVLSRLLRKFEETGESRDVGRREIERFLTNRMREEYGINMAVTIGGGEARKSHPPRNNDLHVSAGWNRTLHRKAPENPASQASEKMRKLVGDIITITVTPGILALLQFKRGVITQEGDKMRCLVACFRGRVYLRSMDDDRQFKEHSLTPELEAELVYEVK